MGSMATPASCEGPGDPNSGLHTWTTGHLLSLPSQLLQLVSSTLIDRSSLFPTMKIPCYLPFPSLLCSTSYIYMTPLFLDTVTLEVSAFQHLARRLLTFAQNRILLRKKMAYLISKHLDRQTANGRNKEKHRSTRAQARPTCSVWTVLFWSIATGVIIYFLHPSLLEVTTLLLDTSGTFSSLRAIIH